MNSNQSPNRSENPSNGLTQSPQKWVESKKFEKFIIAVIILNAIVLGLETLPSITADTRFFLKLIDKGFLAIFTVEIILKLWVYRMSFFKDPWRVFDFTIVSISLLPATGPLSVLRALRILRVLRMISVVPALRKVVSGLLIAVPGLGSVGAIMGLFFYIGAVMATKLFGASFPEWFGSLGDSAYSLFQIMTLESWSMGIVRPVMEKYPMAWLFFIPFILVTTFTMLNLFIAVIVNSMQVETETHAQDLAEQGHDERMELLKKIEELSQKIDRLQSSK